LLIMSLYAIGALVFFRNPTPFVFPQYLTSMFVHHYFAGYLTWFIYM
jgi:hypothetical protein